jgi:hypothetical protein
MNGIKQVELANYKPVKLDKQGVAASKAKKEATPQ